KIPLSHPLGSITPSGCRFDFAMPSRWLFGIGDSLILSARCLRLTSPLVGFPGISARIRVIGPGARLLASPPSPTEAEVQPVSGVVYAVRGGDEYSSPGRSGRGGGELPQ